MMAHTRPSIARALVRRVLALAIVAGAALLAVRLGLPRVALAAYLALIGYGVQWAVGQIPALGHATVVHHALSWVAWWQSGALARAAWLQQQPIRGLARLIAVAIPSVLAYLGLRFGWAWLTRLGRLHPTTIHGDARWLTRSEARRHLRYRPGGLVLGTLGGLRLGGRCLGGLTLALPPARQLMNTLVVGPPGSGKSSGIIISTLLREGDLPAARQRDLLITDLKGELLRTCGAALSRTHDVWVVNPLAPDASRGYNPLAACTDPLAAAAFAEAWVQNTGTSQNEPFWQNCAIVLLQAGILHLRAELGDGATLAHLYTFLAGQTPTAVIVQLKRSRSATARQLAHGFLEALRQNERALGSAFSEITPRFRIMQDARVQATTGTHEVDLTRLGSGRGRPVALFVALDRRYQTELKPLVAGFFTQAFDALVAAADAAPTGLLARPVVALLDEFGNLGSIPRFPVYIASLRSAGVALVPVVQATAQLTAAYGPEGAATIMGSCRTVLALPGLVERDAETISKGVGQATVVQRQASAQRGRFHVVSDSGGRQQAEGQARLLTPDQVQRLPADQLLALVGELPAVRVRQRPYYRDTTLRGRYPTAAQGIYVPRRATPLAPPDVPDWGAATDLDTEREDREDHADTGPDHAGAAGDEAGPGGRPPVHGTQADGALDRPA